MNFAILTRCHMSRGFHILPFQRASTFNQKSKINKGPIAENGETCKDKV